MSAVIEVAVQVEYQIDPERAAGGRKRAMRPTAGAGLVCLLSALRGAGRTFRHIHWEDDQSRADLPHRIGFTA
jgi:hypothetical protein